RRDRLKLTAILGGGGRLHVERVDMAHAAVEIDEDARLGAGAGSTGGDGPAAEGARPGQPGENRSPRTQPTAAPHSARPPAIHRLHERSPYEATKALVLKIAQSDAAGQRNIPHAEFVSRRPAPTPRNEFPFIRSLTHLHPMHPPRPLEH